jgi:hypothetical protein
MVGLSHATAVDDSPRPPRRGALGGTKRGVIVSS